MGRASREKKERREDPTPERQGQASNTPPTNGETDRSRRRFVALIATVLGGTAVAGTAIWTTRNRADQDPDEQRKTKTPKPSSNTQMPEADVDTLSDEAILKAEEAMVRFETIMRPYLDKLPKDHFREQLELPFEQMRVNYDNPYKNGPRSHRELASQGKTTLRQENQSWFSIKAGDDPGLSASFQPATRIMQISTKFDPQNFLDMLVLYHETRHVTQDNAYRAQLETKEQFDSYLDFHSREFEDDTQRFIVTDEASAFAYEIEMLNLYLDGWLNQASTNGTPISIDEMVKRLNGRPEQRSTTSMILQLAYYYFPERMTGGNFSKRFLDKIATEYKNAHGYEAYIFTTKGGVKKYEVSSSEE
jgi:hypothetical protein